MRVLVVAPSWIGDAVLSHPLLVRLKEREPHAAIDVLAPAWVLPVYRRMPEVAEAIAHPFGHGDLKLGERRRFAKRLAHYERAVVLPNTFKAALIPWHAGIALRTGYRGEMRYALLNDARRLDKAKLPLIAERYAALAPGAEYGPAKRWPAQHFATLAKSLAARGFQVWLMGSAKDAGITAEIQRLAGDACIDFAGRTTLDEAIDLMSCAARVVTNDSGLMHVAAALDRPTAALFGSSSPAFTPPLSAHARVITLNLSCSPCFARVCPLGHTNCLVTLGPERVLAVLDAPATGS